MKQLNILVTGVGAIIGYGIINSLRKQNRYDVCIIGMDIYNDAYGKFLCDRFYKSVLAYSDEYLDFVNTIVEKENIDLIIPGIEQDMYRLHELVNKVKTKVVLNNDLLINISKDKLKTYEFFKGAEINVIPTLFKASFDECQLKLGDPFLLKPRTSYASKGIYKIHNQDEFDFYNKEPEANIFQRIVGTDSEEYTIAVFGRGDGTYSDYIILRRKLAQTGATDKATLIEYDNVMMDYVDQICQITKPNGPTNIQLRKEGDNVFLLEINPRISSACSIRMHMGYNDPLKCIDYFIYGKQLEWETKRELNAVRFISDFFYE